MDVGKSALQIMEEAASKLALLAEKMNHPSASKEKVEEMREESRFIFQQAILDAQRKVESFPKQLTEKDYPSMILKGGIICRCCFDTEYGPWAEAVTMAGMPQQFVCEECIEQEHPRLLKTFL